MDNENLEARQSRQSRWGSLISELGDNWDASKDGGDADRNLKFAPGPSSKIGSNRLAPGISSKGAGDATLGQGPSSAFTPKFGNNDQYDLLELSPSRSSPYSQWSGGGIGLAGVAAKPRSEHPNGGALTLSDWIALHGKGVEGKPMDAGERRTYLEKLANLLLSLVAKIVSVGGGDSDNGDIIHPSFITSSNVVVHESSLMGKDEVAVDFVKCGDSIFCNSGETKQFKKYRAMDALGRMAYEMFTLGEGPKVSRLFNKSCAASASRLSDAMSIHDRAAEKNSSIGEEDDIMDMLRKNPRTLTSEGEDCSGVISTMLDANVPFPLCRFVSDLLDDGDGMLGRSEHSFSSLGDVLSDLKQMVDNPDAFLHASSPNRWKLAFGERLYGRDDATKAFMDAAERVATLRHDPMFDELFGVKGKSREVIMVSGPGGAGKSQLVRMAGASLEERGWRFLRCKFDRVVNPEPLSIVAHAFEQYFGSFASCPIHGGKNCENLSPLATDLKCSCSESQEMGKRLERIIGPEGLGILAKHIPSLRHLLTVSIPEDSTIELNEAIVHHLFGKLLEASSSKRSPITFFVDDLQWADPLSLAMLSALVKGSSRDPWNSSSADPERNCQADQEEDINSMFVGSYRDNEVDSSHQFAKVLCNFQSDSSINVTNISITGLSLETLNDMLSESLCVPVRRVRSLSELVMQKTDGQPLHAIEFLQALVTGNLLTHSFVRGWEWDADSIDIFPITDSVAELFSSKLQRLPRQSRLGLQILSCFGSQIEQQALEFVADYDGESSVDIKAAIRVALREGLIEQAGNLVSFSHDLIQKAALDSIGNDALVPLLRTLGSTLIKNASAVGQLDSVFFVAIDLINRVGSDAVSSPKERALFAELNSRAASKAIAVPDFASAAKYAENGISFLSDNHWETEYDISLLLFETASLSHFSSVQGNRDRLQDRINAVFDHAKTFSDIFKTHFVWVKLLAMTDLARAIKECIHSLKLLGEPLDYLATVNKNAWRAGFMKFRDQLSVDREEKFLSMRKMEDCNKVRAMKVMSSLAMYYHLRQKESFLGGFVSCHMIKMSMDYGHCQESVVAAAFFAFFLVLVLEDIDEGSAWGRMALSLMKTYDKITLVPYINGPLYSTVFSYVDPLQSTMEPLAQGIRLSFATGNVEFAYVNTVYYLPRSFHCGKNIRLLVKEIEALAHQYGAHFGNDASSGSPVYSPLLQFHFTPLYNTLHALELGENSSVKVVDAQFPLDKVRLDNNDDILKAALESGQIGCYQIILSYQIIKAFLFRDMSSALKYTNVFFENFLTKDVRRGFLAFWDLCYEALITLHTMRKTGEDRYQVRAENAFDKMKEWSTHSEWNFKNKLLLVEAEMHNTRKDFDKAASCYEASIKAAREHKFIHEEAIASELAGMFFFEQGLHPKSYRLFKQSIECYNNWGACAVAMRVEESIRNKFDLDLMQLCPPVDTIIVPTAALPTDVTQSKKRPVD